MKLVILYGPPAVGKLTVAQTLAKRTDFRVLHNHLLIDLASALFDYGTPMSRDFTRCLREVSLEAARAENLPGVILTFVYARDREGYIHALCDTAEVQGDEICLVQLECDAKTLETRITNPSRYTYGKLVSVEGLRAKLSELAEPFSAVRRRPSLQLSTRHLTPEEAADAICTRFALAR